MMYYYGVIVNSDPFGDPQPTTNYVYACPNCNHTAPSNMICPYVEAVSCGGPLHCPWCGLQVVIV